MEQPILNQLEISNKLKHVATQLLQSNSYQSIIDGNTQANLY